MLIFMAFAATSIAQTIEDFESIQMNLFSGGTNGSLTVVPNPDPSGINTSATVVKMVRGFDGDPWAGWYATLPTPIDVTANKYVHIKVWKPRISPVVFKYEGAVNSGDVFPMQPQAAINQWEELVFDMSVVSGDYVKIVLIPDFETPLTLTEDITLYFDDLVANNDPAVGSAPVQVMDNYEIIPLNYMGNANPPDESFMERVPNPDQSGINMSDNVLKFHRDKDGVPWGGFFSGTPVDLTTNKYMHVKVWKPRVSPIKFKIESGTGSNFEWPSTLPQTEVNVWVDYVFDFSANTGVFPTIVFMPDFEDPLTLTEDIVIYFDDIILNNDPNPFTALPELTLNVDMSEAGDMTDVPVYLAGTMGSIYGVWNEPGSNPNNEMLDPDGDLIYSITLTIPYAPLDFKFFKGTGWGGGDPVVMPGLDPGNRAYDFTEPANITYKWGVPGVLSVPVNPLVDKVQMYPNPVSNELIIKTAASIKEVTITSMLGQAVGTYQINNNGRTSINTADLSNGLYFVTFYGKDGSRLVQKLIKN